MASPPNGAHQFGLTPGISPASATFSHSSRKRKHPSFGDHSDSHDSPDEDTIQPKARRACNECRQQKVSSPDTVITTFADSWYSSNATSALSPSSDVADATS